MLAKTKPRPAESSHGKVVKNTMKSVLNGPGKTVPAIVDNVNKKEKKKKRKKNHNSQRNSNADHLVSSEPVSSVGDIDAIFSTAQNSKKAKIQEEEGGAEEKVVPKQKAPKAKSSKPTSLHGVISSSETIISPDPPVHRYDNESGLPVYKYTGLLVGQGGGTPLCPFDCDCCF